MSQGSCPAYPRLVLVRGGTDPFFLNQTISRLSCMIFINVWYLVLIVSLNRLKPSLHLKESKQQVSLRIAYSLSSSPLRTGRRGMGQLEMDQFEKRVKIWCCGQNKECFNHSAGTKALPHQVKGTIHPFICICPMLEDRSSQGRAKPTRS